MGCQSSKLETDYSKSITQALVEHEKRIQKGRELSGRENHDVSHAGGATTPNHQAIGILDNVEPSEGFNTLSIYETKEIDGANKAEKQTPILAKVKSATKPPRKQEVRQQEQETFPKNRRDMNGAHHLRNVFAKPLLIQDVSSFQAPVFHKSKGDMQFLRQAIGQNFVFSHLSERQLGTMLDAFEKKEYPEKQTMIQQGQEGDFFFFVGAGELHFEIDSLHAGTIGEGASFGDLALLYESPSAASVITDTSCILFRLDQSTFRYIMQTQREQAEHEKRTLLEGIPFLKDLDKTDVSRLADAMIPRRFTSNECLAAKGATGNTFCVVCEGKIRVTNMELGKTSYEDHDVGPGEYFGESIFTGDKVYSAHFYGKTNGMVLSINKQRFASTCGDFLKLISKSQDKKRLSAIRIIYDSFLSGATLASLASRIKDRTFKPRTILAQEGSMQSAALFLVRIGSVEFRRNDGRGHRVVKAGGFFGDDTLTADLNGARKDPLVKATYTISTMGQPTTVGILTLLECRRYFDTTSIGKGERTDFTSIVEEDIPLYSLKKHGLLGAGTFGEVYLVSKVAADSTTRPYALKVQAKFELLKNKQAKGVIRERKIMSQLNSPFLTRLVKSYQDDTFVYMLLALVQGGELYHVIHTDRYDGIREADAKFYAACILEGLSYLHRRNIVYRDLKPENVLITHEGYPVVVDMGFAKMVESKTYTLCGTPLYIAPEVILNKGHDRGADHWSLGVLLFEMVVGYTPFYVPGIDQITLYKRIVKGKFRFPRGRVSESGRHVIDRFLSNDQMHRLGSMAGGIDEIYNDIWFREIDFAALRRKEVQPPWKPRVKNPLDASQFDNLGRVKKRKKGKYPPVPKKDTSVFDDF